MTIALVRDVSDRFFEATVEFAQEGVSGAIDVGLARQQHAAYVDTFRRWGVQVHRLPSDPDAPDCCFIEDRLVVAGDAAMKNSRTCVQVHGGMGYMRESVVERLYRDGKILSIGGGTDEIMKELIAKQMRL